MFKYNGKKNQPTQHKSLGNLFVIEEANQLLSSLKRQELLNTIQAVSGIETSRYENFCLNLIRNVANQCQNLPESLNSYYANQGGFLDNVLNRTEAAVQLFRNYLVQDDKQAELSEEQKLWMYALLSAGILQGIGKLQTEYHVNLYDQHELFLKLWQPLLESFTAFGSQYSYEYLPAFDDKFRCRLNLLLARQLIPAGGFSWIATNAEVLNVWLALLNEDMESAGTLGAILERAQLISSQRYLSEYTIKGALSGGRGNRISTFVDSVPERIPGMERLAGAEFIQWLNRALANGEIILNKDNLINIVQGGLLVSNELFKRFIQENTRYKNWQAVQNSFLAWVKHKTEVNGPMQQEQNHEGQALTGVVVDTTILPSEVHVHHHKTNQDTVTPAIEVEQMTKVAQFEEAKPLNSLSKTGQWEYVEAKMPWLSGSLKVRV